MSRVGKRPIIIPKGVKVLCRGSNVAVEGPKGKLDLSIDPRYEISLSPEELVVARPSDAKKDRAFHGLYRALIQNMVTGVSTGFAKVLEYKGVGYRAKVQGKVLEMALGYSHPIKMDIPEGITITVDEKSSTITVAGVDRRQVGQVAANIRAYRPVEPYKGKGLRYLGEQVKLKEGKAGAKK
jgi:large subunit ribosomal protein L6